MIDDENLLLPEARPRRADATRNYHLILDTARQLFNEQGVATVTMSAIAEAAQVGKGTLYRHFSDKSALCHALLDNSMEQMQADVLTHIRNHDPNDALHYFLEQVLTFVEQHMDILCEASNHASISMLHHPAHLWWRQTIKGLLEQIAPGKDVNYITDVLYIMLDVQTIRFQKSVLEYTRERLLREMRTLLNCFLIS